MFLSHNVCIRPKLNLLPSLSPAVTNTVHFFLFSFFKYLFHKNTELQNIHYFRKNKKHKNKVATLLERIHLIVCIMYNVHIRHWSDSIVHTPYVHSFNIYNDGWCLDTQTELSFHILNVFSLVLVKLPTYLFLMKRVPQILGFK